MLIDPQSKMNIKTINPHLKLTPTQGINYLLLYQQLTEQYNAYATMHMQQCTCNNAHATMHMQQSTSNNAHAC